MVRAPHQLRIIAGALKGRRLRVPEDNTVRPTTDRVRESLFNVLAHHFNRGAYGLEGLTVLDAFAGSGALGFEAISRGANATFLEIDATARGLLKQNAADLGLPPTTANIKANSALKPPAAAKPADLIFLDPPYGKGLVPQALIALSNSGWIAADSLIVAEMGKGETLDLPEGFIVEDQRVYGKTVVYFLKGCRP